MFVIQARLLEHSLLNDNRISNFFKPSNKCFKIYLSTDGSFWHQVQWKVIFKIPDPRISSVSHQQL